MGDPIRAFAHHFVLAWEREGQRPKAFAWAGPVVALTGITTLVLLAVATATILSLDALWQWHEAAGFALLPVLAVKLVPVGLRAAVYYLAFPLRRLRSRAQSIEPPLASSRLTAVPLVAAAALLLASGIVMWHTGDQRSTWSTVHNASAIALGVLLTVHLAGHARLSLGVLLPRVRAGGPRPGAVAPLVGAAALIAGLILAVATVPHASWNPGREGRDRPGFGPPPSAARAPAQPGGVAPSR